uniref:Adenylate kinase isoenzyme 1 n=1 Tax=Parastrongyloides trichosuri TaxID=131310 RepID=A0A0N4Z7D1_PARTI
MSIAYALGKTPVIILIGSPGSGKGTQSPMISKKYGFTHISTGDILREELKTNKAKGSEMAKLLNAGQLLPKEYVENLMKEYMLGAIAQKTAGFIIDGYPRDISQGESFERKFKKPDMIIYLEVPDAVLAKRMNARTGSGRSDDTADAIAKRLRQFKESTMLLIEQYKKKGVLQIVNGDQEPDTVFSEIQKILDVKYK